MGIRHITLIAAILMVVVPFCPAGALEGSKLVPADRQRPYAIVRAEMIKLGWKPFPAKHFEGDSFCHHGVCKQYPELFWCIPTGASGCHMGFFKDAPRRYRVVQVAGEFPRYWTVERIFRPGAAYTKDWFHRSADWPDKLGPYVDY
jgi:hypothetical protein